MDWDGLEESMGNSVDIRSVMVRLLVLFAPAFLSANNVLIYEYSETRDPPSKQPTVHRSELRVGLQP